MIVVYGLARKNTCAAARIYAERFSRRAHPAAHHILRVVQKLREKGCLIHNREGAGPPMRRHVRDDEEILTRIFNSPGTSVRRIAHDLGISRYAVSQVLHTNGLHPYHFQRVQQQLPGDEQQRIYFCEGFLAQNISFPEIILWTDEATFTPNGVFNTHNYLYWGEENPHIVREHAFQYRWSINVWAGIIANQVIGPYFLPPRLNGEIYADFLENQLPVLLSNVPLHVRAQLIFQHDGAPAHFRREVRNFLNARYPHRWIGRGGPIIWPPRSPDLNILDFFVWGHIKNLVEHTRNGTKEQMRETIIAAFNTITPEMTSRATRNIVRRAELCVREGGCHFEQFLH